MGKNYNRVRIGVSRPSKLYEKNINENVSNWVLSDFTLEDKTIWLNSLIDNMSENISLLINNEMFSDILSIKLFNQIVLSSKVKSDNTQFDTFSLIFFSYNFDGRLTPILTLL